MGEGDNRGKEEQGLVKEQVKRTTDNRVGTDCRSREVGGGGESNGEELGQL